jgi:hypothetical protein
MPRIVAHICVIENSGNQAFPEMLDVPVIAQAILGIRFFQQVSNSGKKHNTKKSTLKTKFGKC